MIIPEWILQRTKLSPDRIALIDLHSNKKWTYQDVENEIINWVLFFKLKRLEKGDRVAVLSRNKIELFPIMFACGLTGLMYVPLNWRLSKMELDDLLEDSGASVLLYDKQFEQITAFSCKYNIEDMQVSKGNFQVPLINDQDAWLMIYTGGTTGKPKGVVLSHEAVNCNALNTIASWGISDEDITINYMPLFHTGGMNALSIPILMAGGTVVIGDVF